MVGFLSSFLARVHEYRSELTQPGKTEDLHRKAQMVLASQSAFDGGKVDITRTVNECLQLQHSLSLGSKHESSKYSLTAMHFKGNTFICGTLDGNGTVGVRGMLPLGVASGSPDAPPPLALRMRVNAGSPQSDIFEGSIEKVAHDGTSSLTIINPKPWEATGIMSVSHFQSLTPRFALGIDVIQRWMGRMMPGAMLGRMGAAGDGVHANASKGRLMQDTSYYAHAKLTMPRFYLPIPESTANELRMEQPVSDPLLGLSIHSSGMISASYYFPASKRTELAAELVVAANKRMREATAAIGAKYEFAHSVFRAMLDSNGKITSYLESRVHPSVTLLLSAELDHFSNDSHFGVGMQIDG